MPVARSVRSVDPEALTVADAANLWLERTYRRAAAGQVTWGHYHTSRYHLARVVGVIGPGVRVSSVGKHELEGAVLHFVGRPPSRPRQFQKSPPGRPLSIVTAGGMIRSIRELFCWIADHDQMTWSKPKGFDSLFRFKRRHMQTTEDREREARAVVSGEVDAFTVPELERRFRAGRSRDRLFILLGLNLGFTSIDLSTLRTFEVNLDAERPHVHRRRNKTGVEAKWLLWPETAALLRRHRAPDNPDKRWLTTEFGNPLVETTEAGRRDAVDQAWKILHLRLPGERWLGFRFMRKTGACAVKRLGGLEESEMYLSHQEPGLNKSYANRNWERMWACLEKYRASLPFLGPAWDLDPAECLFTQNGNPDFEEICPPARRRANARSELGVPNVSFHKRKRKYYARVFRRGVTYCGRYHATAERAAAAAESLRLRLEQAATGGLVRARGGRRPRLPGVSVPNPRALRV